MIGCGGPQSGDETQVDGVNKQTEIRCGEPQNADETQEDIGTVENHLPDESTRTKQHHTGISYFDDAASFEESSYSTHATSYVKKPNACVYVENSGSMYGYVGAGVGSDFRNMVYNYLTDINSGIFDNLHLNFVNSKIIQRGSNIDDFVRRLEPSTFKVSGGNGGATDIAEIVKRVFPSDNDVSVLVSDCIISPGKGNNASEYLVNQQTGIKGFLIHQKNLKQTGVVIYRMLGHFKGYYYNTIDDKKAYDGIRPYYIWVMGDIHHLKKLRNVTEPKMKTSPDEICVISTGDAKLKYNIVPAGGKYRISHSDRFTIEKLKKVKTTHGERAVVKLNADFSKMLQDDSYLTDVSNYEVSDKMYRVDNVIKSNGNQYIITISSPVIRKGIIYVRLKNKPPQWVNRCSDTGGGFPDPNAKLQTTYGLSYLIGGVYDAYTFYGDNLAEMKITIK